MTYTFNRNEYKTLVSCLSCAIEYADKRCAETVGEDEMVYRFAASMWHECRKVKENMRRTHGVFFRDNSEKTLRMTEDTFETVLCAIDYALCASARNFFLTEIEEHPEFVQNAEALRKKLTESA